MNAKLEALIKEAATLALECDPPAAMVLWCLHGAMLCGQTEVMADFSRALAVILRDKLVEAQTDQRTVQ